MIMKISVATTSLRRVSHTAIVAICLVASLDWIVVATPAFILVLSTSNSPGCCRAGVDTFIVGSGRIITPKLDLQLPSWIVFLVATSVPIDSRAICSQRSDLFRNSITSELDILLAEIGISRVHYPGRCTIVSINIDL